MKQLAMLVAAGMVSLALVGCGEEKPKQPVVTETTTVVQPQENEAAKNVPASEPVEAVEPAKVTTETQE